jgi:hypothetical protein
MDTPQQPERNTEANIRKAAEAIAEVLEVKQEFIRCHDFLANKTYRLVELLGQAESRGYLLEDSLTLVDTMSWLEMIDWQTKFLSMVLNFTKDPSRKTLRPQRLGPTAIRPQHRPLTRPHVGPPVALGIRLDMARPGDLQPPDFTQVKCLLVDAPGHSIHGDDQLHVAGHTPAPVCPRRRMFRRGLSTCWL